MKLLTALIVITILVMWGAATLVFVTRIFLPAAQETARSSPAGTFTYANLYFDVWGNDSIVSVPENGGSCGELVKLAATHLNSSEKLVLTSYISGLSGYTASFVPSSVTLSPGGLASAELTITIQSGVPAGTYAVSIEAVGEHQINGGTWIAVNVGSQKPHPPP